MSILTPPQLELLIENGTRQKESDQKGTASDLVPVVLLRLPSDRPSTWLLASIDPEDHDLAFGLMSVAEGYPELGYVRIRELESLRGYRGKPVSHDAMFSDADPLSLSEYVDTAKYTEQITLQFTDTVDSDKIRKELGM